MTSTTLASPARREPTFPTRVFNEQAWFAVICWVALAVGTFAITFVVSQFRSVDESAWEIASNAVSWFGFAIAIYLGWTVLQLHVTHGGTRRGFFI
ncbi:MAG TPA: hypothetical protein VFE52_08275 [Devosia sp.]|jgi:hypothetical protein|nr:hypothetical protein [Devosia sp.]